MMRAVLYAAFRQDPSEQPAKPMVPAPAVEPTHSWHAYRFPRCVGDVLGAVLGKGILELNIVGAGMRLAYLIPEEYKLPRIIGFGAGPTIE